EDAIDLDRWAMAGQDLGGLIGDDVKVRYEREAASGDLDILRAGDVLGEIATVSGRQEEAVGDLHDARRGLDERQRVPHIDVLQEVAILRGRGPRSHRVARP